MPIFIRSTPLSQLTVRVLISCPDGGKARPKTRPDIKLGICGEHGGDADLIYFFEEVGLDYVSCSPFRVPAARLAAAQAVIKNSARIRMLGQIY